MQTLFCHGCGRPQCRYDMGALHPGKAIEIKCRDCKTVNRLEGHALGIIGGPVKVPVSVAAHAAHGG